MTISIQREHGNSGDVIVTVPGHAPYAVPGDCTSYTALTTLRPLLEKLAAAASLPKTADDVPSAPAHGGRTPPKVEKAFDPSTGLTSIIVDGIEVMHLREKTDAIAGLALGEHVPEHVEANK